MEMNLGEFQSYISNSFFSKILTVEKLTGSSHWLSSGTFKEKVLITFLNEILPKKLRAKSGFVLFPVENTFKAKNVKRNRLNYELSKQIDIIVFNDLDENIVYQDENIVFVYPEAVYFIAEVKGVLSHKHLNDSLKSLNHFIQLWLSYKEFYFRWYRTELLAPSLNVFFWANAKNPSGNAIQKKLVELSSSAKPKNHLKIKIDNVLVFKESIVRHSINVEEKRISEGYVLASGKSFFYNSEGELEFLGDKTLYFMYLKCLEKAKILKNRFLFDHDENENCQKFLESHEVLEPDETSRIFQKVFFEKKK